jgi:hypothetical protein
VLSVLLGALWSLWPPPNKNLWTPSFVLWCASWAMLVLLVFHQLIDRHSWPVWGGASALLYRHLFANWMTPRDPVTGVRRGVFTAGVVDRLRDGSASHLSQALKSSAPTAQCLDE